MTVISSDTISILLLDDHPEFLEMAGSVLEAKHELFAVKTVQSVDDAVAAVEDGPPDCVISAHHLSETTGRQFCKRVRETHSELPFILFTGEGSESVASEAISAGMTDYFQKGESTDQYALLANRILNAVSAQRTARVAERREELMRLTQQIGGTGGWELRVETDELLLTDGARHVLELDETGPLSL